MTFTGADTQQLRDFAARLTSAADRLDHLRVTLGRQVESSTWDGRDADAFRADWYGHWSRVLVSASTSLTQAAVTVRGEADQQDEASRDDGGVSGGGSFGGRPVEVGASVGRAGAGVPLDTVAQVVSLVGLSLGGAGVMGNDVVSLLRRVGHNPDGVLSWFGGQTRTLGALAENPVLKGAGKVLGVAGLGLDGLQAYQAFSSGDMGGGVYHSTHVVGDAVKFAGPMGYVVGSGVNWYADIIKDANIDWDPHSASNSAWNPFAGDNWQTVWAPALAESYTPSNIGKKLAETGMSFVENFL